MKPICVGCERFMRPKKNGFPFVEGRPVENTPNRPIGKGSDPHWAGYKLWFGDLWECPTCHQEVVVGVALNPFRERYMPDFEEQIERHKAKLFVKDC